MINSADDFERAQEELRVLEERLQQLQREYPVGSKGFTKAGVHKAIARIHDELALYEGNAGSRQPINQ